MSHKKTPTILLAYPSSFHSAGWAARLDIKTSQLLLASYLARFYPVICADFEIEIGSPVTAMQIKRFERKVKKYLAEHEFDILALSCWTSLSYLSTLTVARICRELYPQKLIVVGGYHPSALPQDFILEENLIDYIILGEGENALKEIADNYSGGNRPDQATILNSSAFRQEQFVAYNWDLIDGFVQTHYPDGLPNIYIYLSRGCPFGCSFCMEPLKEKSWRAFSAEQSVNEIVESARRFKARGVAICDACFGKSSSWRKDFFQRLVDLNPDFWIIFETRPEYIDEEDIRLLAKLKTEIQFGIESGSPEMLSLMHKTKTPQRFLQKFNEVSNLLSDNGILHRANLIFNHPGETRKTLNETFAFIDSHLQRSKSYLMWAQSFYMHFPGCELYNNMDFYEKKYGSRFGGNQWWKSNEDQYDNSTDNTPSADLSGDDVGLWSRMFNQRGEAMKASLAPRAFKFAAAKYFMEWRDDPRYKQD